MIQQRVTQQYVTARALAGLQGNVSRLSTLQEKLSSGRELQRPSDSPAGTSSSLQLRAEARATRQHITNADNGIGWLGATDTALTSALDQVRRVRDLTLQGMSAGVAGNPEAREAMAAEINSIRESLISVANTRFGDRPVFGGVVAGPVAYQPDGTYVGEAAPVNRTVGANERIRVDTDGATTFGTGPDQLFAVLTQISTAFTNDPAALGAGLERLDGAMRTLQTQLADVGARYNRLTQVRQTSEDRLLTLKTQLSDIEDIDLPETIMKLQLQEVAYQAALGATARAIQPSLMDFLR
jgi:flagellar hook-associated protein 3 FlgL